MWTKNEIEKLSKKDGFRLRGLETTRLDTFMDAAFAFATTMLVISVGDIPDSYQDLILALKGAPAFIMSAIPILLFWLGHRKWSRRFGIEDGVTITISISLILVMLIYVYPLKLMFSALGHWATGGWLPSEFKLKSAQELINLFIIYGLGYSVLTLFIVMLYVRAKKLKKQLFLNELELNASNQEISMWLILTITGFASALFALIFPPQIGIYAGFVYFNLPITMNLAAWYWIKKHKRILNR